MTDAVDDDVTRGLLSGSGKELRVLARQFAEAVAFYSSTLYFRVVDEMGEVLSPPSHDERGIIVLIPDDVLGDPARLRSLSARTLVAELTVEGIGDWISDLVSAGCQVVVSLPEKHAPALIGYVQFDDPFGHRWSLRRSRASDPPELAAKQPGLPSHT